MPVFASGLAAVLPPITSPFALAAARRQEAGGDRQPRRGNSVSLVRSLEELAPGKGFQVVEAAAPKSSDALSAARQPAGKAEAIYILPDSTAVSALEAVIDVLLSG